MSNSLDGYRVAIILVNWNGWRDCAECVSSVLASAAALVSDIWLVDNDSADGSVARLVEWCGHPAPVADYRVFDGVKHIGIAPIPCRVWIANGNAAPADPTCRLTIVRSGGNLGFAGGNNSGITAAGLDRYDYFWLLNTDTVIGHEALPTLVRRARLDSAIGMVGSTLLYYSNPVRLQAMGGGQLNPKTLVTSHIGIGELIAQVPFDDKATQAIERRMSYVVGASLLATRDFISAVGLMQEDYFLYFEELDWALRGDPHFKVAYAAQSFVYHKVGGSSAKVVSEFSQRLFYRNRIRFIGRFFPQRKFSALASMVFELVRHILKRRFQHAKLLAGALLDTRRLLQGGH